MIVGVAAALALLTERRWAVAAMALVGAPIGIGLFAAYGAAVDWHQFVLVWQVEPPATTAWSPASSSSSPALPGLWSFVPLNDPFWTVGMVGLAAMLLRRPLSPRARIPLAFAAYALLMTLTASTEGDKFYGWYRFTVDALCYVGVAHLLVQGLLRLPCPPSGAGARRSPPCGRPARSGRMRTGEAAGRGPAPGTRLDAGGRIPARDRRAAGHPRPAPGRGGRSGSHRRIRGRAPPPPFPLPGGDPDAGRCCRDPRISGVLERRGFGAWGLDAVYSFVYEAAMEVETDGRRSGGGHSSPGAAYRVEEDRDWVNRPAICCNP